MKKQKLFTILLTSILLLTFLATFINGAKAVDSPIVFTNPDPDTSSGSGIYLFQDFNVSTAGAYISNIQAYTLTEHDTEEWYMTIHPVNSTGYPIMGTVLATSDTVGKLHANPSWNLESFTFSPDVWLNGSTYYAFVWHSATWQIYRRIAASSGVLGDTSNMWNSSVSSNAITWVDTDGQDIYFIITGDPNADPTAAPTPLVTPFDTSGDGLYGGITWYIVALLIILLPAGLMYYVKLRSLGFMLTGLAIGSGLGYLLMPSIVPLWLLVVIIIGLVVSFFKDSLIPTGGSTEGAAE